MSGLSLPLRIALGVSVFAAGAAALFLTRPAPGPTPQQISQSSCATRAYAEIGGPFSLIDQTGAPRTESDLKGAPSLVFFGFTYCPDICPMTLVKLREALDSLPEGSPRPRPVLISIDPARDTPEQLALYATTEAFPRDLMALTGSEANVKAAAEAFKAAYWRIDQPDSAAGYTMGHTDIVYLMDAEWRLATFFTFDETPAEMAACIAETLS